MLGERKEDGRRWGMDGRRGKLRRKEEKERRRGGKCGAEKLEKRGEDG
jgi:hypothetical protein